MKFSVPLISGLAILTPVLGCLNATGTVWTIQPSNQIISVVADVYDNGGHMCSSAWGARIDQDGHISLGCILDYVYAVTTTGNVAWYGYSGGQHAWSWAQATTSAAACPKCLTGLPPTCQSVSWNVTEFC